MKKAKFNNTTGMIYRNDQSYMMKSYYDPNTQIIDEEENEDEKDDGKVMLF